MLLRQMYIEGKRFSLRIERIPLDQEEEEQRYRIVMNVERSVNSWEMSSVECTVVLTPNNGMLKYACR